VSELSDAGEVALGDGRAGRHAVEMPSYPVCERDVAVVPMRMKNFRSLYQITVVYRR
jgi:hypothetical protein